MKKFFLKLAVMKAVERIKSSVKDESLQRDLILIILLTRDIVLNFLKKKDRDSDLKILVDVNNVIEKSNCHKKAVGVFEADLKRYQRLLEAQRKKTLSLQKANDSLTDKKNSLEEELKTLKSPTTVSAASNPKKKAEAKSTTPRSGSTRAPKTRTKKEAK